MPASSPRPASAPSFLDVGRTDNPVTSAKTFLILPFTNTTGGKTRSSRSLWRECRPISKNDPACHSPSSGAFNCTGA